MPSEAFFAAVSAPPKASSANSAQLKDAGIFLHSFQPQPALRSTFKKSAASPNCLAVSTTHVFTAQAEKAVVHVYNREKGNQEAVWAFQERILSIALALDDTVLVAGTESGGLILSDTVSGRFVSTPASHLQGVDVLAVDTHGCYVLSGSGDSTVLVWSLLDLLSFPSSSRPAQRSRDARHALSGHNAAITALVVGDSAVPSNIAVSGAKDNTAIVWDYVSGSKLRTVLLESSPLCLCLDPAQRALYSGYEDGSVQRIDFYQATDAVSSVHSGSSAATPLQPAASSRWTYTQPDTPQQDAATRCLDISYDGTTLLSGHSSGAINTWDVGRGRFTGALAQYAGAPITNLCFLPPSGLSGRAQPSHRADAAVKPRPLEPFSGADGGKPGATYGFTTAFPGRLGQSRATHRPTPSKRRKLRNGGAVAFAEAVAAPFFDDAFLAAGIRELEQLASPGTAAAKPAASPKAAFDPSDDFMPVTDAAHEQAEALRARLARLEDMLEKKDAVIEKVQKERNALALREREALARRANKVRLLSQRHDEGWRKRQLPRGAAGRQRAPASADVGMAETHVNGLEKHAREVDGDDMDSAISTTSGDSSDAEGDQRDGLRARHSVAIDEGENSDKDYSSSASNSDLEGFVDTREIHIIDDEAEG